MGTQTILKGESGSESEFVAVLHFIMHVIISLPLNCIHDQYIEKEILTSVLQIKIP